MSGISVRPLDRLRCLVVVPDVAHEFFGEVLNRGEDAASDHVALDFGEPQFDLVEPRGIGRRVVQRDVGVSGEEVSDLLSLMGRQVVNDDVDLPICRLMRHKIGQKGHELGAGMAARGFTQDLTGLRVQGRVQRQRAVPVVLEAVALRGSLKRCVNELKAA